MIILKDQKMNLLICFKMIVMNLANIQKELNFSIHRFEIRKKLCLRITQFVTWASLKKYSLGYVDEIQDA